MSTRALFASLLLVSTSLGAVPTHPVEKRLIEFGWDEPDTSFMKKHIGDMEKTPFDGCVFHAYTQDAQGKRGDFLWGCWSKKAFSEDQLQASLADLKQIQFKTFTHNFLRFNTAPADLDWFDDHSAILTNCRVAAKFARDGHCAGLLFDTEQYNGPLFNYPKQRDAKTKSWDQYAAQVRKRGREVMQAFQEGYPDATIFLTFGYSLPWVESGGKPDKLPQVSYGLLAPFLDGMVEAANGKTRIVDGHELSYGYKDVTRFARAYRTMSQDVLPIVADAKKYRQVFSFGFGVWMDDDWRKKGWDTTDFEKNFYTPRAFEQTVRTALTTCDEYVWIYTEKPKWWTEQGGPADLPAAYEQALRRATAPAKPESLKSETAKTNITSLETAMGAFEVDIGRYPTTAEGLAALVVQPPGVGEWRGPYIAKLVKDPWGNAYVYRYPGEHNKNGFDLYSRGPDGKDGGGDDITNW